MRSGADVFFPQLEAMTADQPSGRTLRGQVLARGEFRAQRFGSSSACDQRETGTSGYMEITSFLAGAAGTQAQPGINFWQTDCYRKTKSHGSHILDSRISAAYGEKWSFPGSASGEETACQCR